MKIATVVGARPQFVKAAVVSREIRKKHTEVLIHTGQHFDYNMSEQFFEELDIPKPAYNLGISGGTHAEMTGKMLIALEEVLIKEKPDWLLVYGDTNSTLAAALAAVKLHIPICHVEAGARTHSMTNPEEINRLCTDHISTLLLASTRSSMDELEREGLSERSHFVGDPMYDAFVQYSGKMPVEMVELKDLNGEIVKVPDTYIYLTCHREENTREDNILLEILKGVDSIGISVIYPVHPRNRERVDRINKSNHFQNIIFTNPVGYLESLALVKNAQKVVTDSGGLQREAFFARKKCVTILDFVVWQETMVNNRNTLSRPKADDIVRNLKIEQTIEDDYEPFGDGHSAEKIVNALEFGGKR